MSLRDCAKELDLKYETLKSRWKGIKIKLGIDVMPANAYEKNEPEKAAEAMMSMSLDPEVRGNIKDLAASLGVPYDAALALQKRVDTRYVSLARDIGSVKATELKDLAGYNAFMLAGELAQRFQNPELLKKEKVRDLAVAFGVMVDKHQLLDGKPTERLSIEDRRGLEDLIPLLMKEADRRGLIPTQDPLSGQVTMIEAEVIDGE